MHGGTDVIHISEAIALLEMLPQDLAVQTFSINRHLDFLVDTNLESNQTEVTSRQTGPRVLTIQIDLDSWKGAARDKRG